MLQHTPAVARREFGYKYFHELVPSYRNADLNVARPDTAASNASQLIGKGSVPTGAEQQRLLTLLKKAQIDYKESTWKHWPAQLSTDNIQLLTYQRAQLGASAELLHSTSYQLPKSRVSYVATVNFEGEGRYIAQIKSFLKVQLCSDANGTDCDTASAVQPLRFAVATLYQQDSLPDDDGVLDVCYAVTKAASKAPAFANYAVELHALQRKVVWAETAQHAEGAEKLGFGKYTWLFVQYPNFRPYLDISTYVNSENMEEDLHV